MPEEKEWDIKLGCGCVHKGYGYRSAQWYPDLRECGKHKRKVWVIDVIAANPRPKRSPKPISHPETLFDLPPF